MSVTNKPEISSPLNSSETNNVVNNSHTNKLDNSLTHSSSSSSSASLKTLNKHQHHYQQQQQQPLQLHPIYINQQQAHSNIHQDFIYQQQQQQQSHLIPSHLINNYKVQPSSTQIYTSANLGVSASNPNKNISNIDFNNSYSNYMSVSTENQSINPNENQQMQIQIHNTQQTGLIPAPPAPPPLPPLNSTTSSFPLQLTISPYHPPFAFQQNTQPVIFPQQTQTQQQTSVNTIYLPTNNLPFIQNTSIPTNQIYQLQSHQVQNQKQLEQSFINNNNNNNSSSSKSNRIFIPLYCGTCRMYGCQCFYGNSPPQQLLPQSLQPPPLSHSLQPSLASTLPNSTTNTLQIIPGQNQIQIASYNEHHPSQSLLATSVQSSQPLALPLTLPQLLIQPQQSNISIQVLPQSYINQLPPQTSNLVMIRPKQNDYANVENNFNNTNNSSNQPEFQAVLNSGFIGAKNSGQQKHTSQLSLEQQHQHYANAAATAYFNYIQVSQQHHQLNSQSNANDINMSSSIMSLNDNKNLAYINTNQYYHLSPSQLAPSSPRISSNANTSYKPIDVNLNSIPIQNMSNNSLIDASLSDSFNKKLKLVESSSHEAYNNKACSSSNSGTVTAATAHSKLRSSSSSSSLSEQHLLLQQQQQQQHQQMIQQNSQYNQIKAVLFHQNQQKALTTSASSISAIVQNTVTDPHNKISTTYFQTGPAPLHSTIQLQHNQLPLNNHNTFYQHPKVQYQNNHYYTNNHNHLSPNYIPLTQPHQHHQNIRTSNSNDETSKLRDNSSWSTNSQLVENNAINDNDNSNNNNNNNATYSNDSSNNNNTSSTNNNNNNNNNTNNGTKILQPNQQQTEQMKIDNINTHNKILKSLASIQSKQQQQYQLNQQNKQHQPGQNKSNFQSPQQRLGNSRHQKKFAAYESIYSSSSCTSAPSSTPSPSSVSSNNNTTPRNKFLNRQIHTPNLITTSTGAIMNTTNTSSNSFNRRTYFQSNNSLTHAHSQTLCRHGLNCKFKRDNKCKYYHPPGENTVTSTITTSLQTSKQVGGLNSKLIKQNSIDITDYSIDDNDIDFVKVDDENIMETKEKENEQTNLVDSTNSTKKDSSNDCDLIKDTVKTIDEKAKSVIKESKLDISNSNSSLSSSSSSLSSSKTLVNYESPCNNTNTRLNQPIKS